MKLSLLNELKIKEVIELFKRVFSGSEGEVEGQVIADFFSKSNWMYCRRKRDSN